MGQVRTWREVLALRPTQAERRLIRACKAGEACELGDDRPETADPARTIRAELLRYLILGGCEKCRVTEAGVQLVGAWVSGELDLSWATARGPVLLFGCGFAAAVWAIQAHLPGWAVRDTERRGPERTGRAGDARCLPQQRLLASGAVNISSALIGGQLACEGGRFETPKGVALSAQGAQVTDAVFLSNGFHASGEVSLVGARIDGQLSCDGGRFGKPEDVAFNAQRLRVEGSFIWRRVTVENGTVHLAAAHVGDLVDDPESWPDGGRVYLDGFTYDRITASFTDARRRLEWLAKGDHWNGAFFPQPYAQLARVLRAMGHDRAARDVLVERERLLRAHARREARIVPDGSVRAGLLSIWRDLSNIVRWLWDITTRWTIGYGHRPVQSVYALLLLFAIATVLADRAWQAGDFAPASDVILTSPGWQALAETAANPAQDWSAADGPGRDWESFSRYAFAADVVIPLIDFGRTQAWAPSTTRGPCGWLLWWARWVLSGLGWLVTALGAAAVTGIIGRARE